MSTTKTETTAKKDVQKLQRAIVDGLEDVKAQDIQVFDTENLSPLFERVIVASGSSNRQTKALAASVRDAVREAGFDKPRVEGEDNGEWIIVDCGPAVVHIMQPAIRHYYHLEELWGETPVRIKLGAAKPVQADAKPKRTRKAAAAPEVAARKPGKPSVKAAPAAKTKPAAAGKTTAGKTTAGKAVATKSPTSRTAAAKTAAAKTPAKKVAAKKAPSKSVAGQDTKPMQVLVVKPNVRPPSKSAAAPRARPSAKTAGRAAAKTASPTAAAKKPSRATSSKPAPKKWSRI
ncbi:ribosome silencing factor [Xylophilus ampelinus]|uniref:Ribosomal silencing factor RsfS n=1 Tax=Xylophilus ampelinus TaxID=54067 RepID=A0A318SQT9_9BURK|nr:ribosome silencing factor [Xylophilus ampelinus]MCS4509185.1 ribosome silencing factor [Xylophilus ampelinus]PYE79789.1 ribosome-associated protein [Xylophilus ampelinus]